MQKSASGPLEKGIVLIDKPETLTSMQCVERVKDILKVKRAGHSGTLDPKVTGVMLIALNEATKAMPVLIGLDKEYEGVMRLHGDADENTINQTLDEFRGRITQTPPVRSAVARKPRERDIHEFRTTSVRGREVRFRVSCESGTYIRKLCHDLGERLGTGAHMTRLRRTRIDCFSLNECVNMSDVEKRGAGVVIPLEMVLKRISSFKKVIIKKDSLQKIRNGMPVRKDHIKRSDAIRGIRENDKVGIYYGSDIIALGVVKDPKAPLIKTDRVFLPE